MLPLTVTHEQRHGRGAPAMPARAESAPRVLGVLDRANGCAYRARAEPVACGVAAGAGGGRCRWECLLVEASTGPQLATELSAALLQREGAPWKRPGALDKAGRPLPPLLLKRFVGEPDACLRAWRRAVEACRALARAFPPTLPDGEAAAETSTARAHSAPNVGHVLAWFGEGKGEAAVFGLDAVVGTWQPLRPGAAAAGVAARELFLVVRDEGGRGDEGEVARAVGAEDVLETQHRLIEAAIQQLEHAKEKKEGDDLTKLALCRAVMKDDLPALQALVKAGADVDTTNPGGQTLLALAVGRRKDRVADFLRACGASATPPSEPEAAAGAGAGLLAAAHNPLEKAAVEEATQTMSSRRRDKELSQGYLQRRRVALLRTRQQQTLPCPLVGKNVRRWLITARQGAEERGRLAHPPPKHEAAAAAAAEGIGMFKVAQAPVYHAGAAVRRDVQVGLYTCRSCGGKYTKCSGNYGYKSHHGTGNWTIGTTHQANMDYTPESPNADWCSKKCEDVGPSEDGEEGSAKKETLPPREPLTFAEIGGEEYQKGVRHIMWQLLSGVAALHAAGVRQLDISAQNVCLRGPPDARGTQVRVTASGMTFSTLEESKVLAAGSGEADAGRDSAGEEEQARVVVRHSCIDSTSLIHRAPELYSRSGEDVTPSLRETLRGADVWACGVLFAQLLTAQCSLARSLFGCPTATARDERQCSLATECPPGLLHYARFVARRGIAERSPPPHSWRDGPATDQDFQRLGYRECGVGAAACRSWLRRRLAELRRESKCSADALGLPSEHTSYAAALDLLASLLAWDASARLSASEALEHEYFRSIRGASAHGLLQGLGPYVERLHRQQYKCHYEAAPVAGVAVATGLRALIVSGDVQGSTRVWSEGMGDWTSLIELCSFGELRPRPGFQNSYTIEKMV